MAVQKAIENLFDLSGKTAVVTGGAKGIGEGISMRLAQAGAKVVICDRAPEALDQIVKKITGMGLEATGVTSDVSIEADCVKVVKKAVDTYGGLDILVNNASYYPTISLVETTQDDWDKVFATNCRGAFMMTREAAKVMIAQNETAPARGGSIILVSSIGAYRANRVGMCAYHSSKGAQLSFKNHISGELGPHYIRVNCILPGAISPNEPDENGNYEITPIPVNRVPLRVMGTPHDISGAVLYLASDAGRYVTGVELVVDGGMYKLPTFGYPDLK